MSVNVYSLSKEGAKKVSNNFRVREFACQDGSDPVFIDPALVQVLQSVRNHFNRAVHINSGFRTASHNKKVGGAAYSQHLYGRAADIRVEGVGAMEVYGYICAILPNSGGVGLYSDFVHVDTRTDKSRWNG